ncbi:MAG TPA: LLM class flavin-dependent oxidoreductase [Mycobacteriales bacterium]|nr:LLM class flavin-dependent oxidoreductase [Mycobacteriales bacterium]
MRLGLRVPATAFADAAVLREVVAVADDGGLDQLSVGDHVTFHGGQGNDGMVGAAALAGLSRRCEIGVSVYQLPLRHPVPVARQVQGIAALASGGFALGVGVGGEDRTEVRACGVDPATRGRRTDESLALLRRLLTGETVTAHGEFFDLDGVSVLPPPPRPVPLVVGGRSDAALRRAGAYGDGWLGVWVSSRRYADAVTAVQQHAVAAARTVDWRHGLQMWCGFGPEPARARALLAAQMEQLYALPFAKFEKWCPAGPPDVVAEAVAGYAGTGVRDVGLIAVAATPQDAVAGAVAVRRLLPAD